MTALLYLATAMLLLYVSHRFVRPLTAVSALVLLLLPFCFTGRALLTDRVLAPIDNAYVTEPLRSLRGEYNVMGSNGGLTDIALQMLPWRKAVQWHLQRGQWPLLNPFIMSGDILASAAQPAAYSPFTLIAVLLPVAKSMTFTAAIAFFVAGLGAFLFAREIGCSESAAFIAAAGFMYSAGMSFFIMWPLGFTWALFPFVLLSARTVVHAPSLRSFGFLTVSLVLMILAGHPESIVHLVFLGCAYAALQLALNRRHGVRALATAAVAGVVALMLCAVYLLPLLEAVEVTDEHRSRTSLYAKEPRGISLPRTVATLATDFLPFLKERQWLIPSVPVVLPETAAVGSIVLALAVFGVVRLRSPETLFLLAVAVFGLLMRAGWKPLARFMQQFPLFDIALNERFSFAASFAIACLAAVGAHVLATHSRDIKAPVTFTAVLLVLSAATVLILRAGIVGPNYERYGDYKIAAEIGCLAIATLLLLTRIPRASLLPLLLGLILLQRSASELGLYPLYPNSAAYPPVPLFRPLKTIETPFRTIGISSEFMPGTSAFYELEDPRGYQAMTNVRYWGVLPLWSRLVPVFFNHVDDLRKPFLSLLNVRFAIVPRGYSAPDGWRIVAKDRGAWLLENSRVLNRAFIPRNVRLGVPMSTMLEELRLQEDFAERAWITVPGASLNDRSNGPGNLTVRQVANGYHLDADMQNDGWIVISNVAWPGWRFYIGERRVKTHIANHAFISVFVPKGRHTVRAVYLPDSFVIGRAISFGALLLIAAMLLRSRLRQALTRRNPPALRDRLS
jgi:hypothetical protein